MDDNKEWLWFVQTNKGDFFFTVVGEWSQEEAAKKLLQVLEHIKLDFTGLIPRKRPSGGMDTCGTIVQQEDADNGLGYMFFAGKDIWRACGRETEFEAEKIRMEKERETP